MKTKTISLFFCLFFLFVFLSACNEDLKVNTPTFDVVDYIVKDEIDTLGNPIKQVIFNLKGNADVISFYSGELFHQYEHKDGRVVSTDALTMSFEYFAALASGTVIRENQVTVVASTDFSGELTEEDITSATWIDVTDRFNLLQVKDITEQTATSADVSDLAKVGEPLYIAFRYVTPPQTDTEKYCTWDFFKTTINQETILGSTTLVSQSIAALEIVTVGPDDADTPGRAARTVSTTARLRFRANILAANLPFLSEAWGLLPAIYMADDTDLGPDLPIHIKTRVDPELTTYAYDYSESGVYKVTFVATNVTVDSKETVVKELQITLP